jgi:Dockerin type I domain/Cysteine-rich secretory protein family
MTILQSICRLARTTSNSRLERSPRLSRRTLRLEALENRSMFAVTGFEPTAQEQYMLELVNRARLDPLGEVQRNTDVNDLNQNLAPGTITSTPKQPLAFNPDLIEAARGHSSWLISSGVRALTHRGPNNNTPGDRMVASGYAPAGTFGWGENIAEQPTRGTADEASVVLLEHDSLFTSKDHRPTIMDPSYREIGIGIRRGTFKDRDTLIATQDFASRQSRLFLTGVVFDDRKVAANRFYTVGEGIGGIRIQAKRVSDNAVFDVTSYESGGYQLELETGTYQVQFSGNGIPGTIAQSVVINSENVKVDLNTAQIQSLSLSMSTSNMPERNGRIEATVTRSESDLSTELVVNIASSLPLIASVPVNVTIPANQASKTFDINAVDDSERTLTRSSTITVSAANSVTASSTVHVIDDESPSIWQNSRDVYDVDNDGVIAPIDILLVINRLRRQSDPLAPNVQLSPPYYFDVDGDWNIAPIDVLLIINQINRRLADTQPHVH